jgi:hypothetical protein
MKKYEYPLVDFSDGITEDLDEEALALLKMSIAHVALEKVFAPDYEINRRSKKKGIPNFQAMKELIHENQSNSEHLVKETTKLLIPKLSKETKHKLGIKEAGRPKGSRNKVSKISQNDFYMKLRKLVRSKEEIGEKLTIEDAAKVLNLGGARQLRKRLRDYGDKRKWKDIVTSLSR